MNESLGVDLGNVIIDHVGFGTTPEFVQSGDYNVIPPMSGVIEALWQLNQERFAGNIFVVYNASDVADQKILSWLKSHDFFSRTDIHPARVMRTKNGRDKSSNRRGAVFLLTFVYTYFYYDNKKKNLSVLILGMLLLTIVIQIKMIKLYMRNDIRPFPPQKVCLRLLKH